ncbi:hypothetical protein BH20VER3_BH20VER3_10210 [soil metagenome]
MRRILPLLWLFAIGTTSLGEARAQESLAGIDLLYPEFAHPKEDAQAAIKRRDFRFIMIDRRGTVSGVERYPRLRAAYGTRFIRHRFRIFVTRSRNFSYNLRARAYATEYNQTLLRYLLKHHP